MLPQAHSAVNQSNYGSIGSHTLADAAANAKNHISKQQRVRNMIAVQNANRNGVGLPHTNKPLGLTDTQQTVLFDSSLAATAFGAGVALMALTKTTAASRRKVGKSAQMAGLGAVAAGSLMYYTNRDSTLLTTSVAGIAGTIIGARMFRIGFGKGPMQNLTRQFTDIQL